MSLSASGRIPSAENFMTTTATKQPPKLSAKVAATIKKRFVFHLRQRTGLGPSAEVLSFASPKDKPPKKRRPDCLRPYATFHFASGKPASRHSVCGAAQLAARLCRFAQSNGGKSDHDALALFGANARSLNDVPQALTHGWRREPTACRICDEMGF